MKLNGKLKLVLVGATIALGAALALPRSATAADNLCFLPNLPWDNGRVYCSKGMPSHGWGYTNNNYNGSYGSKGIYASLGSTGQQVRSVGKLANGSAHPNCWIDDYWKDGRPESIGGGYCNLVVNWDLFIWH